MFKHETGEYNKLVLDIKNNDKFLKLKEDVHHGTTKYEHCEKVSHLSFMISKFLRLDYKKITRAALLHDFFYGQRNDGENSYLNHPFLSARNAEEVFNVSKEEADMIKTHMFPYALVTTITPFAHYKENITLKETTPTSKGGWVICLSDVLVSFTEWGRYRISFTLSIILLFIINMVTLNK